MINTQPFTILTTVLAGIYFINSANAQSIPVWTPGFEFKMGAMNDFLVQHRCPDGSPPTSCAQSYQQWDNNPIFWRKRDWPGPGDGLIQDSVILSNPGSNNNVLNTYSTYPFGPMVPPNDGGDLYSIQAFNGGPSTAVALKTRSGDIPHDVYFNGCGGTSWVLWKTDLPVMTAPYNWGWWGSTVAQIGQANYSGGCNGSTSPAYTRYRLEMISVPFIMFGAQEYLPVPTILSEHYNGATIASSTTLERFFFGLNWGRYRWEYWSTSSPARGDLHGVCPDLSWGAWAAVPPLPNIQLSDCRMWTNIISAPGNWSLNQYGWGWP